jgi:hypothetical protein
LLQDEGEFQDEKMQGEQKGKFSLQEIVYAFKEIDDQVYGDKRSQTNCDYLSELEAYVTTNDPHGKSMSTLPFTEGYGSGCRDLVSPETDTYGVVEYWSNGRKKQKWRDL